MSGSVPFILAPSPGDDPPLDLPAARLAAGPRSALPLRMSLADCMEQMEAARVRHVEREAGEVELFKRALLDIVGYSREDAQQFPTFPPYYVRQPFASPRYELDYIAAAAGSPMVYACVTKIATDLASLPTRFYKGTHDDHEEIQPERGNVSYLWNHPNKGDSPFTLSRDLYASYLVTGNSGLFIDTFGSDFYAPDPLWELWSMPGHEMRVCVDERRRPIAYEWQGGTAPVLLDARQILYFKNWSPRFEPRGMSALEPLRSTYMTRYLMGLWNEQFYSKGAQVAGVWSTSLEGGRTLAADELKRVKDSLRRLNSGVKWAWDPVIVQNLKYERSGVTHKDMNFTESLGWTDADVCHGLSMPLILMEVHQGKASAGGADYANALISYYENTLQGHANLFDGILTTGLCSRWGDDVFAKTDFSGVLALQSAKLEQMKSAVIGAGRAAYDVNEVRRVTGQPARKDPKEKAGELFLAPSPADRGDGGGQGEGAGVEPRPDAKPSKKRPTQRMAAEVEDTELLERRLHARRASKRRQGQSAIEANRRRFERAIRSVFTGQEHRVIDRLQHDFELRGIPTARAAGDPKDPEAPVKPPTPVPLVDLAGALAIAEDLDTETLEALFVRMIQERGEDQVAELGIEFEVELQNARASRWIQESAHRVLDQINTTSGKSLRTAMAEVAAEGGGYQDFLGVIRETFDERRANAGNIARTETTGAYNFATLNAAKASGVAGRKIWLTADDELVREAHRHAEDGGSIGIDEQWLMRSRDGVEYAADYPGDPNLPADLRCNCRCNSAFEPADENAVKEAAQRASSRKLKEWFASV